MPQQSSNSSSNNKTKKKKKKGRAPAHQNTFAFRHNPKSKKTAAILEAPIEGVCRRCRDKLEWRKRYRKYKPLTQPSKCNLCQKRNVFAAYHTICASCAQSSPKAIQLLQQWKTEIAAAAVFVATSTSNELENREVKNEKDAQESTPSSAQEEDDNESSVTSHYNNHSSSSNNNNSDDNNNNNNNNFFVATRVCAICVNEPALPGENDGNGDDSNSNAAQDLGRPLRLRERKTLERQRERAAAASSNRNRNNDGTVDNDNKNHEQHVDADEIVKNGMNDLAVDDDDDGEPQDPFLQAVGGADKLLTGDAYQQKLLLEHQQQQQQT